MNLYFLSGRRRSFILTIGIVFLCYSIYDKHQYQLNKSSSKRSLTKNINISSNINIFDLNGVSYAKFQCIKAKKLLNNITTNICLHNRNRDQYVSGAYQDSFSVWEEKSVTRILQIFIRHPNLHFIDIGAHIGTYTMYVAALGRLVLAIECFIPNLLRLRRAIQMSNVYDSVVVIQNAIFIHSGQVLRLSIDTKNIGGQKILFSYNHSKGHRVHHDMLRNNSYIVRTIKFDDVFPILNALNISEILIKMDIEGSESFAIESGHRIFDYFNIPFVAMEWKIVRQHVDRVRSIFDFFTERNYDPTDEFCMKLSKNLYHLWPEDVYWLRRNASSFC